MAKTANVANKKPESQPKFPYTTKPSSLRKLLQDIPKKPKPPKFDSNLLKSWGFKDTNDQSVIRVLKAVGLLSSTNEPTELYSQYMNLATGAATLGPPIKRLYEPLFSASHAPYKESTEILQNLFNIHSGGSKRVLDQQIQTFKALCENTSFDGPGPSVATSSAAMERGAGAAAGTGEGRTLTAPVLNINLHIHLPENKTRRDYEAMIEDIGRYIFGKADSGSDTDE